MIPSHLDIDTGSVLAGHPVTVDGHTFVIEGMDHKSWGVIAAPHPGGSNDTFGIANEITLRLKHAPWLGCPAADFEEGARGEH